jgi:hypothetical protein
MKRVIAIVIVSGAFLMTNIGREGYVRYNSDPLYGINVYEVTTGSGFGPSTNINFNIQKINQQVEVGIMLKQSKEFSGVEFMYIYFSPKSYKHIIRPYFLYNFIYRCPFDVKGNEADKKGFASEGKVTTLEHAIGFGTQIRIAKFFYLNSSVGIDAYMGLRGPNPNSFGIHGNYWGIVPLLKFGLGYKF